MTELADSPPVRYKFYAVFSAIVAACLLVILFGLSLAAARQHSPAGPEVVQITRGWTFWQSGRLLSAETPPLADMIVGGGARLDFSLPAPQVLGGWVSGNLPEMANALFWQSGADVDRLLMLSRLPSLWIGVLLAAVLYRWGADLYGYSGGLMALLIAAFSPSMLAYASIATPDFITAAFVIFALFAWSRWRLSGRAGWLFAGGLITGLAITTGYSALILLPIQLVLLGFKASKKSKDQYVATRLSGRLFGTLARLPAGRLWVALTTGIVLWTSAGLVFVGAMMITAGTPFPMDYLSGLSLFAVGRGGTDRLYLFGRFFPVSNRLGWFYGPLIVLGAKLPLPTLILLGFAVVMAASRRIQSSDAVILVPGGLMLIGAMLVPSGLEVRTLLPVILLGVVFAGRVGAGPLHSGWLRPLLVSPVALSLIGASIVAFPNYISFTNVLGRAFGHHRIIAGSNVDWGEDLRVLASHLQNRGGPVYLSLDTTSDPAAYGINYRALPGYHLGGETTAYSPLNPPSGIYAISVNHLVGLSLEQQDTYGYFRQREPDVRIGNSIYVYEVHAQHVADSGWLAQCAIEAQVERVEVLRDLAGVPNLNMYTFDCRQTMPFFEGPGWILLPVNEAQITDLGLPDFVARYSDGAPRYNGWMINDPLAPPVGAIEFPPVSLPLPIAGQLELIGFEADVSEAQLGGQVILETWWRVRQPPPLPITVFSEIRLPNSPVAVIQNGTGIAPEVWQPGMVFVQRHRLPLGSDFSSGTYSLVTGLINPVTGERVPVSQSGDRIVNHVVLRAVQVKEQ